MSGAAENSTLRLQLQSTVKEISVPLAAKIYLLKKKREKRGQWSDEWDSQPAAYLPAGGALHTLGTRLIIVTMTVKNFRLHRHDPGPCAGGAGGARASG